MARATLVQNHSSLRAIRGGRFVPTIYAPILASVGTARPHHPRRTSRGVVYLWTKHKNSTLAPNRPETGLINVKVFLPSSRIYSVADGH